jgi:enoyl-CoA hydratase/carnithine racemase
METASNAPTITSTSAIAASLDGHVGIIEITRPPHNFFDLRMLTQMADAFEAFQADPCCRAILLAAQGKSFCAGADFAPRLQGEPPQAERLIAVTKPVVAAVHGSAIGGGLGVALVADFRVTCKEARFAANFTRLGFHPGFGLSVTLPRLVGVQMASLLLLTGRRIDGTEAVRIGLADVLVDQSAVRQIALELAREIAAGAPLAVQATRATLRGDLADQVRIATGKEAVLQAEHFETRDFVEGIAASAERRTPVFVGA